MLTDVDSLHRTGHPETAGDVCLFLFGGIALLTAVPYTPAGAAVGLCPLPAVCFALLAAVVAGYMALSTLAKKLYVRRYKELI